MIKGSNMTEMNSDYLAALRSWRNKKRDFADSGSSIERLKFREAMQRERAGQHSTPEPSLDDADDALLALQQLADSSGADGGYRDMNSLSALALRESGNTNARPPFNTIGGRVTRQKVTITGAADSLSKAGLSSYKTETNSPMMDVSTGHSTYKTAGAKQDMQTRLQRQHNTLARYGQMTKGYGVAGTMTADDTVLSYPSHDKTVRKMLMDPELTKLAYTLIDSRIVRGVLR